MDLIRFRFTRFATRRNEVSPRTGQGGATRMPAVRCMVNDVARLPPLEPGTVDPDVAVAMGAALYAGMLDGVVPRDMDVVDGLYTWP
jgi:molecular chaperone DnaK (HSP70)